MKRIIAGAIALLAIAIGLFFALDAFAPMRERLAAMRPGAEAIDPGADTTQIEGASAGPSTGSVATPVEPGQISPPEVADDDADDADETAPTPDIAPSFDVVRVARDGSAVIAGQAAPGADVAVMLGDAVVGEAKADPSGNFVAFLSLGTSDEPRVLTMRAGGAVSEGSVILQPSRAAPTDEGEAIAALDPDTTRGDTPDQATETAAVETGETVAESDTEAPSEMASDDTLPDASSEVAADAEGAPISPDAPVAGSTQTSEEPAEVDTAAPTDIAESSTAPAEDAAAQDISSASAEPTSDQSSPRVLLADGSGVRVVQEGGDGPDVAAVTIDAISYDNEGEVALSGRTTGEGPVRVYIDNEPLLTTNTAEGGQWRAELPDVDTGTYTLRVDELDASGAVVSRSETPFRREAVEAIQALAPDQPQTAPVSLLTVQPGNTLWGIAKGKYGSGVLYVRVFEANASRIRNPDLIYPGQIFALPD